MPQPPAILIHTTSKEFDDDNDYDEDEYDDEHLEVSEDHRLDVDCALCVNEWCVVELNGSDKKAPKIFKDAPLGFWYSYGTTSALVGPYLYLIRPVHYGPPQMYSLDTRNPANGWSKPMELPFNFLDAAAVCVDGSSLYMFPVTPFLHTSEDIWGYIYDTVEQKFYPIEKPSPSPTGFECFQFSSMFTSIWAYWKEQKVVVAPRLPYGTVGQYNIAEKSWSRCPNHPSFPTPPKVDDRPEPHTVLDGVLYLFDTESSLLYAYDLRDGSHQVVQLRLNASSNGYVNPENENGHPHLVPLGDSKICFVWHVGWYGYGIINREIVCATYRISLHPSLVATLLDKYSFPLYGRRIVNCMPFDSFRGFQDEETDTADGEVDYYNLYPKLFKRNRVEDPRDLKESKLPTEKMQTTLDVSPQLNMNICGTNLRGRSISSSLASPTAANNSSMSRIHEIESFRDDEVYSESFRGFRDDEGTDRAYKEKNYRSLYPNLFKPNGMEDPRECYNPVLKESRWPTEKMQTTVLDVSPQLNMNVCGTNNLRGWSISSSLASSNNSSSILTPYGLSQNRTSMSPFPSASFSTYLARGTILLKKCIKK